MLHYLSLRNPNYQHENIKHRLIFQQQYVIQNADVLMFLYNLNWLNLDLWYV
ncbi:unnamed protein product [Schistosoma curassoni]|uniref:Uncharacterized protein n=1 Tax=Schistosoma curassoni TaxID=6186 RepID=A0A183K026_9TREM|nr:unnamed protein product [Schistosoma curassoni]